MPLDMAYHDDPTAARSKPFQLSFSCRAIKRFQHAVVL